LGEGESVESMQRRRLKVGDWRRGDTDADLSERQDGPKYESSGAMSFRTHLLKNNKLEGREGEKEKNEERGGIS